MKKMIIGNWKMNLSRQEGLMLVQDLIEKGLNDTKGKVILCPPTVFLPELQQSIAGTGIALGAQDCSAFGKGAYTGQTSAKQLADFGVSVVILGHAERRSLCGETNADVRAKAQQACEAGLLPIICIGESGDDKASGRAEGVLRLQIEESCPETGVFVLAYEPLWAIGTGLKPTPKDVDEIFTFIKSVREVAVVYGGSVQGHDAADFLGLEILDGVLVGGAALKTDSFLQIAQSV